MRTDAAFSCFSFLRPAEVFENSSVCTVMGDQPGRNQPLLPPNHNATPSCQSEMVGVDRNGAFLLMSRSHPRTFLLRQITAALPHPVFC